MNNNFEVFAPVSENDFKEYYRLRWEVLRKPWKQPEGSEKDELDSKAIHAMIKDEKGTALAVGRLHFNNSSEAQVRYMAVSENLRSKGLGQKILAYLEKKATAGGAVCIVLQARDNAVDFYKKNGYEIIDKSFIMYDEIQHYKMQKELNREQH